MEPSKESGSDAPKRKRIVTPARKEQNRIAQKLYRQREKSRRRSRQPPPSTKPLDLRPRLDSGQEGERCVRRRETVSLPDESITEQGADVFRPGMTDFPGDVTTFSVQPLTAAAASATPALDQLLHLDSTASDMGMVPRSIDSEFCNELAGPTANVRHRAVVFPPLSWPEDLFDACIPLDDNVIEFEASEYATGQAILTLCDAQPPEEVLIGEHHSALPMSGASGTSGDAPSSVSPSLCLPSSIYDTRNILASRPTQTDECPQLLPQHSLARVPQSITAAQHAVSTQALQLPDPWRNTLQFTQTTMFNAFLHIALSLGFNLGSLTGLHCQILSAQSPFYRPTTPRDDPQALLAAARRPGFPSNLQPTLSQIIIPHHPFLDLLPFPALRERAITLAAAAPHHFSMLELKQDVYVRGALVCWVGGRGAQPWDVRSWEAAPWFLRKWRLLVGSDDGELSKTSQWWRVARGEQVH